MRNERNGMQDERETEIKRMTKIRCVFMLVLYVAVKKRHLEDKLFFEEGSEETGKASVRGI